MIFVNNSSKTKAFKFLGTVRRRLSTTSKWFSPGIGVKRWLVLTLTGVTLIGVGLAILVLDVYRTSPETWWLPLLSAASLRFLVRPIRALIFGVLGFGLILTGIWGLNRTLMKPFLRPGKQVVDALATHRRKERGPRVITIGGGHGLATVLRGLKEFTHNITAIVSVADDGGSSGRIRKEQGILPPGDMRNCLAALSSDEALMSQLFQYRFPDGDDGMVGHSFGNLFITALADIMGSFEEAVAESGRVLAVHGRVLPSTLHDVRLVADVRLNNSLQEIRVLGESKIPEANGKVRRIWLEPNNPPAYPETIKAILNSDLIIVGPGSLYTSILPNLLVPDIVESIRVARALKIFILNVATQHGETDHYSCFDHIKALENHLGNNIFDIMVVNNEYAKDLPEEMDWVKCDPDLEAMYPIYQDNLIDDTRPWRHDSEKLAKILIDLLQERTGPLVE
jgi:uncharacterized cofD-like protein